MECELRRDEVLLLLLQEGQKAPASATSIVAEPSGNDGGSFHDSEEMNHQH